MIDPKELRIGNLLQANGHTLVVKKITDEWVTCTMKEGGLEWCPSLGIIDPIPLTPQWLERCGLIKDRSHLLGEYTFTGMGHFIIDSVEEYENRYHLEFNKKIEIKYVHKLQNLYFELTGEALTIKPV
jgi:hypothetical protein